MQLPNDSKGYISIEWLYEVTSFSTSAFAKAEYLNMNTLWLVRNTNLVIHYAPYAEDHCRLVIYF